MSRVIAIDNKMAQDCSRGVFKEKKTVFPQLGKEHICIVSGATMPEQSKCNHDYRAVGKKVKIC